MLSLETIKIDDEMIMIEENILLYHYNNEKNFIEYTLVDIILLIKLYKKLKDINFNKLQIDKMFTKIKTLTLEKTNHVFENQRNDYIIKLLWYFYQKFDIIFEFEKYRHSNGIMCLVLIDYFEEFFEEIFPIVNYDSQRNRVLSFPHFN